MSSIIKRRGNVQDQQLVELFRLRYCLREATESGVQGPEVARALARLRQLASTRGDLLFEYRRWCVQLEMAQQAA